MRPGGGPARPLVVALAIVVGAGCSSGLDDLPRPSTTTTVDRIGPTITTEVARRGTPLVVDEQGVTAFADPYDRSATLGSYAVVIRNPDPALLAAGVRVRTSILDGDGAILLVDTAFLNGIMPGTRMAVGRMIIEPIRGPVSLQIAIEVTDWFLPTVTTALTAEAVSTESDPYGGAATRFAVRSALATVEQGVDVTAIYRDGDGRLLGAESSTLADVAPGATVLGQIPLLAPIPGTATTEVFIGRGFAAQTVG